MSTLQHQMVIIWSEEDDCYWVHLPDFPAQTNRTHGDSDAEAAQNGEEVLEWLLEEDGLSLPKPNAVHPDAQKRSTPSQADTHHKSGLSLTIQLQPTLEPN